MLFLTPTSIDYCDGRPTISHYYKPTNLRPKWHANPFIVPFFWPEPYESWSNVAHYKGSRVPFWTHSKIRCEGVRSRFGTENYGSTVKMETKWRRLVLFKSFLEINSLLHPYIQQFFPFFLEKCPKFDMYLTYKCCINVINCRFVYLYFSQF